ncbi:MAG: hypothetical protein KF911_10765 [Pseudomonadales bacterium]|jgi:hypothetical protein|nr:hypothetical protein [Pseudomonadales bacterium]
MSASEITEPLRLSLTLDPDLVLERLILRRLSGLKRKRGQDWLRSLLVQGFLAEGQWIRSECPRDRASSQASRIPTSSFASWLERTHKPARPAFDPAAPTSTPASPVTTAICPAPATKPFAHLRKVIG